MKAVSLWAGESIAVRMTCCQIGFSCCSFLVIDGGSCEDERVAKESANLLTSD